MNPPIDDTPSAIGRDLSAAYLPIVREPLPRELKDLVLQLVASEMRKRRSGARPPQDLQFAMAQLAPDPRSTDPMGR
jgi:hypothetical protein